MDYILSEVFVVHIIIAIFIFIASILIGNRLLGREMKDYTPIASSSGDSHTGFNAVYRILFTPISIVFVSIIIYNLNLPQYIQHIWSVGVIVLSLQIMSIIVMGKWKLVNVTKVVLTQLVAIALTYYLYSVAISKGLEYIIPNEESIRTELWIIVVLFLYGIFRDIPENNKSLGKRKNKYLLSKIDKLAEKYSIELDDFDDEMSAILLSIMVYENHNRPKAIRLVEGLLPSKTRYIMQTYGAKSDADSIKITADNIKPLYEAFIKIGDESSWEKESALRNIFNSINPGDINYSNEVLEVYRVVKAKKG